MLVYSLYNQCSTVNQVGPCEALAEVYYAAVRAFGREAPSTAKSASDADSELIQEYEDRLATYKAVVAEARVKGDLPAEE